MSPPQSSISPLSFVLDSIDEDLPNPCSFSAYTSSSDQESPLPAYIIIKKMYHNHDFPTSHYKYLRISWLTQEMLGDADWQVKRFI
jgi:hypothetical protein